MPARHWVMIGAIVAALAVAAGALGAHALEKILAERQLRSFETAVRYQLFHAVGLILVGLLAAQAPAEHWSWAGWLFLVGVVLFSGGIYAWLSTGIQPFVHIVPIGGVLLILGWIVLAVVAAYSRTGR